MLTLCHTVTHPWTSEVGHTSRTPHFSRPSTKTQTKPPCTNSLSIVRGGFCPGAFVRGVFCLEAFVRGDFCPYLLLSEYICYNRKLKITLNFMFHMYDKNCYKRDVTCSLPPPPVTNCHTFSDPLTPRA